MRNPSSRKVAGAVTGCTRLTSEPGTYVKLRHYATSDHMHGIIESGHFMDLATNPYFSTRDFKAVPARYRALIPDYIKDYVSLHSFAR